MHEYEIVIAGLTHTVLLRDEDAVARGLVRKAAPAPANKARDPLPDKARDGRSR